MPGRKAGHSPRKMWRAVSVLKWLTVVSLSSSLLFMTIRKDETFLIPEERRVWALLSPAILLRFLDRLARYAFAFVVRLLRTLRQIAPIGEKELAHV